MKPFLLPVFILLSGMLHAVDSSAQTNYKTLGAPMPRLKLVVPLDLNAASLSRDDPKKTAQLKTRVITNGDLSATENTIVMMFLPTCDHCQDQAKLMKNNIALLKNNKVLLMATPNMIPYLGIFDDATYVSKYPDTFIMGVDSSDFINNTFLKETTPQINIYSPSQKLLKIFVGSAPIDSLKKYLDK